MFFSPYQLTPDPEELAVSPAAEEDALTKVMAVAPVRAILLLSAFSFHTVFDGLAVGLQTEESDIWQVGIH